MVKLQPFVFQDFNPKLSTLLDVYHVLRHSLNLPTSTSPTLNDTTLDDTRTATTDYLTANTDSL